MWEMPPIFNNQPGNHPNHASNQLQQQNQPPHFHNPMNDPLGINSQNGPPGHGPPGHTSGGGPVGSSHHTSSNPVADRGKTI